MHSVKHKHSQNHYKTQEKAYRLHVKDVFGSRSISTIAYNEIADFLYSKLEQYSHSYVHQMKQILVDIFARVDIENVASKVDLPSFDNTVNFNMHIDDARRLYRAIKDYPEPKYRSFFLFGLQGRRRVEIAYLRWQDIDFRNKRYYVRPEINKNNQHDMYGLSDLHVKTIEEIQPEGEYVHMTSNKTPLYHIRKRWVKLLEENDIPYMRFHDLRHLLGALAINEGYSLEHIGKALGHRSHNATKRYSKLKDTAGIEVVENVYKLLN